MSTCISLIEIHRLTTESTAGSFVVMDNDEQFATFGTCSFVFLTHDPSAEYCWDDFVSLSQNLSFDSPLTGRVGQCSICYRLSMSGEPGSLRIIWVWSRVRPSIHHLVRLLSILLSCPVYFLPRTSNTRSAPNGFRNGITYD